MGLERPQDEGRLAPAEDENAIQRLFFAPSGAFPLVH